MNGERCDRDRVTAILTLKDAASPLPWVTKNCADAEYDTKNNRGWWWVWQESKLPHYGGVLELDRTPDGTPEFNGGHIGEAGISDNDDGDQERADAEYIVAACNAFPDVAAALLAALDTIDRTGNLHFPEYYGVDLQRCVHDQHPWPCPTELALIRGNESKGETT